MRSASAKCDAGRAVRVTETTASNKGAFLDVDGVGLPLYQEDGGDDKHSTSCDGPPDHRTPLRTLNNTQCHTSIQRLLLQPRHRQKLADCNQVTTQDTRCDVMVVCISGMSQIFA